MWGLGLGLERVSQSWSGEDDGRREEDFTEVGAGVLVVSGSNATPLLEPAEPSLDGVALFVELGVELWWSVTG